MALAAAAGPATAAMRTLKIRNKQLDNITLVLAQSKSIPKILQRAASSTHLTQ